MSGVLKIAELWLLYNVGMKCSSIFNSLRWYVEFCVVIISRSADQPLSSCRAIERHVLLGAYDTSDSQNRTDCNPCSEPHLHVDKCQTPVE